MFINLQNWKKRKNYLFLSNGLFLKYFKNKKSLKKSKIIKFLMAKYLRKLFLLLKLQKTILSIKNTPVFLLEFLTVLNTPIIHKFLIPGTDKLFEDKVNKKTKINFYFFFFLKTYSFTFQKKKKKGRIKRKITRKLIFKNRLVD